MKKALFLTLIISMVINSAAVAQTAMADAMRADGKIYVVVGVVVLIFGVLFAYLIALDRRLKKLENTVKP